MVTEGGPRVTGDFTLLSVLVSRDFLTGNNRSGPPNRAEGLLTACQPLDNASPCLAFNMITPLESLIVISLLLTEGSLIRCLVEYSDMW